MGTKFMHLQWSMAIQNTQQDWTSDDSLPCQSRVGTKEKRILFWFSSECAINSCQLGFKIGWFTDRTTTWELPKPKKNVRKSYDSQAPAWHTLLVNMGCSSKPRKKREPPIPQEHVADKRASNSEWAKERLHRIRGSNP